MKKPSEQILEFVGAAARELQGHDRLTMMVGAIMRHLDNEAERALPKPVVCSECAAAGKKSRIVKVFRGGATMDLYYEPKFHFDEDGREHHHDENRQAFAAGYECEAGHRFTVRGITPCWCGWPNT